jgi:hypothetical protein
MTRRGEENESEVTDRGTIRERRYLYAHAERRKKKKERRDR